ncbi:pre-rRNA-processing protein esf1-like [Primulina huaijiensis]|uniref:pre-rRNA-processing protein esf1-like n=1 Tax=Primulina huaijiensis TaxID=1492673 RepID=UPI003CC7507C
MGSEDKKKQKKKSSNKKSSGKGKDDGEAKVIMDDRFVSAQSDPRFMEAPKRRAKVAIDSRFQRVFTDRSFTSSGANIDKRGKPTNKGNNKNSSSLKHYYRIIREEDENEESAIRGREDEVDDFDSGSIASHTESESDGEKSDDSNEEKGFDESASTTSTDSDDEFMDDEEEDTFLPSVENVPDIEKETHRLAVVNLDWSQVRAVDLYVLLTSFLPKGGQIFSVTVYPSEFGLKRMEEEGTRGPVGLFDDNEEEHDNKDDDDIDKKKLRAYELCRLRYYFAVVIFDSSATADYLYKTCDGVEFERSGNKLDLRFIPDSTKFEHQPRDVATEAPADYEGLNFQTRALQQSNVHLTWDEDEPQRAKTLKRKLNTDQLVELELKEFLASDESETDDSGAEDTEDILMKKIKKQDMYRALIQSEDGSDDNDEEGDDQDMEVTFNSSLENISKRILEKKDKKSETVWDEHLRKRREKKKANKNRSKYSSDEEDGYSDQKISQPAEQHDDFFIDEPSATESKGNQVRGTKRGSYIQETTQEAEASIAELELLLADDNGGDTNIKGYSLKPKKKKGKKGTEIPDEGKIPTADVDDPRFSSLFTSSLFALDPTDPQFKRSATYSRLNAQKRKITDKENDLMVRSEVLGQVSEVHEHEHEKTEGLPQGNEKHESSSLVKSLKLKLKQLPLMSQGKVPSGNRKSQGKSKKEK